MHVTTVTTCSHLHALPQGRTHCKQCDPLISRLPTELLIEIFHRCLDTSLNRTDIAPIILSGVCGAWRRICISTATLWSSLAIYNPRWKVIPLVRMCLKRADSCPLRILIHESGKLSGERQATVNSILRMLIDRCHLWKYIDFRFRDFQEALGNIPVGSLKALKHASVSMPSYAWSTTDKDKVWDIVHSSPNLESIHYGKSYEKFQVHTPWAQLKIIHCGFSVPIQQLLHSLHYCRNPAKSIELPRLRSLEVSYFDKRFSIFFDALVSPQLTSFKIHYSHTWDDSLRCGNLSNLKNFAAHSGFTLRSFGLQDPKLEAEELLEWLEAPFLSMVRFPDVHPSYMESVAARLRMTISRCTEEG